MFKLKYKNVLWGGEQNQIISDISMYALIHIYTGFVFNINREQISILYQTKHTDMGKNQFVWPIEFFELFWFILFLVY